MRKNSQAAQKGPDARRRPRAAREAYSLYVERAAEGAKFLGGGLRPPSETSPQDSLRRQSRRSKAEHSCLVGEWHVAQSGPSLTADAWVFRSERGLRPRPERGRIRRGPSKPPPRERSRWAFFSSLLESGEPDADRARERVSPGLPGYLQPVGRGGERPDRRGPGVEGQSLHGGGDLRQGGAGLPGDRQR